MFLYNICFYTILNSPLTSSASFCETIKNECCVVVLLTTNIYDIHSRLFYANLCKFHATVTCQFISIEPCCNGNIQQTEQNIIYIVSKKYIRLCIGYL